MTECASWVIGQYVYWNFLLTRLGRPNQTVFLHDRKVKTKNYIPWERSELLRWNKKAFPITFIGHSNATNCLRPEIAPFTYFMEHVKRLLMINCCCLLLILWVPKELIKEKTLILSKRTFYLDPRIIKLCFSNSMSWYNLKQPPKGLCKKAVLKIFGKFKLQVLRQNFLDRLFYWTLPGSCFYILIS